MSAAARRQHAEGGPAAAGAGRTARPPRPRARRATQAAGDYASVYYPVRPRIYLFKASMP